MTGFKSTISRDTVIAASEANLRKLAHGLRFIPGAEAYDGDDLMWNVTSIPFAQFNPVLGARLTRESVNGAIESVVARCSGRAVPMVWWVGPEDTPPDLAHRLQAHGFTHAVDLSIMGLDLEAFTPSQSVPAGLVIKPVGVGTGLRPWSEIAAPSFGVPSDALPAGLHQLERFSEDMGARVISLLGHIDGTPVATAMVLFGAQAASIYYIATLPYARRKGVGSAMTRAACVAARERGYQLAVLEASKMGLGVYGRLGFREYGAMGLFHWAHADLTPK